MFKRLPMLTRLPGINRLRLWWAEVRLKRQYLPHIKEQRQQLGARATWAIWMTALANVILAVVTWQYVSLTNRLVKLQIEPSIEAGLDEPIMGSTTFVVQNNGAEPVENVIVNIRCL